MADLETIRTAFERNRKVLSLKPGKGQYTTTTHIRLVDGTTCEVEHKHWKFLADVGENQGGNDAGPGPSVLERAALGSCLAIGYVTWAAVLDVPIGDVQVDVEAQVDARGTFGVDDVSPGCEAMRYRVYIESPAPEERVQEVIEKADAHSPVLHNFRRPIPIEREVEIVAPHKQENKPQNS